jgi:hypothetical protein
MAPPPRPFLASRSVAPLRTLPTRPFHHVAAAPRRHPGQRQRRNLGLEGEQGARSCRRLGVLRQIRAAATLMLVNRSSARTVAASASYRRSLTGGTHDSQVCVRFLTLALLAGGTHDSQVCVHFLTLAPLFASLRCSFHAVIGSYMHALIDSHHSYAAGIISVASTASC